MLVGGQITLKPQTRADIVEEDKINKTAIRTLETALTDFNLNDLPQSVTPSLKRALRTGIVVDHRQGIKTLAEQFIAHIPEHGLEGRIASADQATAQHQHTPIGRLKQCVALRDQCSHFNTVCTIRKIGNMYAATKRQSDETRRQPRKQQRNRTASRNQDESRRLTKQYGQTEHQGQTDVAAINGQTVDSNRTDEQGHNAAEIVLDGRQQERQNAPGTTGEQRSRSMPTLGARDAVQDRTVVPVHESQTQTVGGKHTQKPDATPERVDRMTQLEHDQCGHQHANEGGKWQGAQHRIDLTSP